MKKLKINTTRFGLLDLREDRLIHMPNGMLGFPQRRNFIILEHGPKSPFLWYQSVDDGALAFVIANPRLFKPDYTVNLEDTLGAMAWNGNGNGDHLELYIVVNIPKGHPEKMTGNLIGPLLINSKACQAVQIIITDSSYSHNYPLLGS